MRTGTKHLSLGNKNPILKNGKKLKKKKNETFQKDNKDE